MRNWSEYVWLVNHMTSTGFIDTIRELWWDVRPHHNFGTVEVRMCDMPGNLEDTLALAALVHCLVKALSDEIDEGAYQHDCHPMMVRQNKWRAARFGVEAQLVDTVTLGSSSVAQIVGELAKKLQPTAEDLGCIEYLERCEALAAGPTWADRQLAIVTQTGDLREVVRSITRQARLSPPVAMNTSPTATAPQTGVSLTSEARTPAV
jgi:carboxylate-amine ligase